MSIFAIAAGVSLSLAIILVMAYVAHFIWCVTWAWIDDKDYVDWTASPLTGLLFFNKGMTVEAYRMRSWATDQAIRKTFPEQRNAETKVRFTSEELQRIKEQCPWVFSPEIRFEVIGAALLGPPVITAALWLWPLTLAIALAAGLALAARIARRTSKKLNNHIEDKSIHVSDTGDRHVDQKRTS